MHRARLWRRTRSAPVFLHAPRHHFMVAARTIEILLQQSAKLRAQAASRLRARAARPLREAYGRIPESDISSCPEISRTDPPRSGTAQISQRARIVNSFAFSTGAPVIVAPTNVEESLIVLFSLPRFVCSQSSP